MLELHIEAFFLKQGDSAVTNFFTKLRMIWDELDNFWPEPIYSNSIKCSRKIFTLALQRKIKVRVMQFTRGFKDQYNNITSHVLFVDLIQFLKSFHILFNSKDGL